MSVFFRVDDYPCTKPAEFDRHNLESFGLFHDVMSRHWAQYILGVIPAHTSDRELCWLGRMEDMSIALHGVSHDERFPNEFREHQTEGEVADILCRERARLETLTGQQVLVYIPPHNVIDKKTVNALKTAGFAALYGGPESDPDVLVYAERQGLTVVCHMPPHFYGRSDELFQRGAVRAILKATKKGVVHVGLHLPWETNIGLEHLDRFLGELKDVI